MSSSLQGFVFEKNLNSWRYKCRMKVWESPFIPSHLTSKKFQISLKFTQSITQQSTNNQNYLFNITFQNLEFWDVTNLPPLMNLVLEIRRGQKEIGQVWGSFKKSINRLRGFGVLPPLEISLRSHQYSDTPSLFLTGPVFSNSRENPFSGSSGSGITFFLNSSVLSSWYGSSMMGPIQLTGLAPILNNYRYLMVVHIYGFSCRKWVWVILTV